MTTWSSGNPNAPFLACEMSKWFYDTSTGIATRVVSYGSLMGKLRLSTLKKDGHDGLRGSGHQSEIPYVHRDDYCIAVYSVVQALELNFSELWLRESV
jgi:hypothetical protein